ncbi:hypothetical protein AQUCO_02800143v1 [Aquilegia coerulea]|uniref:Nitrate reductase n=1 Tax=Aquilegia coerulea TaxID=218851 RepID=A0A2G5D419_AQUCA|nr:hypothetical protein AQUCO_02800143v1 [Aquilegia coerulea]
MAASVRSRQFNGTDSPFRGGGGGGVGGNFISTLPTKPPKDCYYSSTSSEEEEEERKWSAFRDQTKEVEESILDPKDGSTADNWIVRNPSMIRLTGKHPFNSEPPLNKLMHHGFITPVSLHYVRNHGYVPKATWEDWSIEVCGLVKRPMKLTMNQLVKEFRSYEFPVTLVCAGNRRKEQNQVKQTVGFNWGAAGTSTSVWRGVRLRDVLKRCGIINYRKNGELNVCFEGAEDLQGGGGSKYGTSIKKEYAMDPSREIIIAYMQNGELLLPDHGFPVRMIIPGFIGGRMVKWLARIIVATAESQNHYHFKDNRVFPSHVDSELANAEAWWYKPEYIINELNINSVITTPSHEEILLINSGTVQRPYTIKGYAYSGGGKKVTRVEVTLDNGESWLLCTLDHKEKPSRYGKYWCWCFWSLEVEVLDLIGAKEIAVRAWDQTLNTQPDKLIWNVMGMMNNCWFRIKANMCKPYKGEIGLVFEHPTQAGNQPGGWMVRMKSLQSAETQNALKKSVSSPIMNTSTRMYSLDDVKKHNSAESAWIIVRSYVYDCTPFLKEHPGGIDSILINAGSDCTEEFDAIHSDKAKTMLEKYRIGELIDSVSDSSTSTTPNNSVHDATNLIHLASIKEVVVPNSNPVALIPREKTKCKLVSKISLSHDVRIFRFAFPSPDQVLGLAVGKHIYVCASVDNKLCMRAYTPTSAVAEVGYFELLIKIYYKGINPAFPNGGILSQYLESLPLGASIDIKGPLGHIEYTGRGNFTVHGKNKFGKKLAMIAGGTGITPIYQVMLAIMKDPEDETEMYVVYANRTEDDILLKKELDSWAEQCSERVKVWYVVGKLSPGREEAWKYSVGRIGEEILREHIPHGSKDTLALACGPPAMIQFAITPNLEKMNYDVKETLLVF